MEAQNRKKEQGKYQEAVEKAKEAALKVISEATQELADCKAEVGRLQAEKTAAKTKLRGLGFFKFSEKAEVKAEIARLSGAVADAQQHMKAVGSSARQKAEEALRKHPLPQPPKGSGSTGIPSGASADVAEKARKIASVLSLSPMTARDINAALNSDYTALQIANAAKFILGVGTVKVPCVETDRQGELVIKEYTAYYLG